MQGENQRSLTTMLLVAGAFLAVYYASTQFFGGDEAPAEGTVPTAELTGEARAQREAEERRDAPERLAQRQTATITTPDMVATIDNLGGGLSHVQLLGERYVSAEQRAERAEDAADEADGPGPMDLVTTSFDQYQPLRIDLPGVGIPADAVWQIEQESPTAVRLRWAGNGLEVTRRIEAGSGAHQLWQTVRVRNVSEGERDLRFRVSTWHYVPRDQEGGGMFGNRSAALSQGLCRHAEETERKAREDLAQRHGYRNAIEFVAIENAYFVTALAPEGEAAEMCGLETEDFHVDGEEHGSLFEATLLYPVTELDAGEEHVWRHLAYVGPKAPAALERAGHGLVDVVNLGMFAIIARAFAALLTFIQGYVSNWGLAIIILTIFVRIALFPLTDRSFRSMARIRKLKPEMDEINERFKDEAEKKQAAIMDLYRRHGINPLAQLGGCLPVLLQMPVFFALYTSLSTNVELYHRPFALWWQDLSAPDPYFVLPIALGGLMYLQQKLTPTTMDPAQAKVMQFMPVIVTAFMLFLPAGLCLYMLTNSILGISQQKLNEWRLSREKEPATAVATVDAASAVRDDSGSKSTSASGSSASSSSTPGTKSSGPSGRSRRG